MFVCFTGIDGAGKSTLAKSFVGSLEQQGISSRYIYARFQPRVLKPFSAAGKLLFLRDKDMHEDYRGYRQATGLLFRNRLLAVGYEWMLLLDYFAQVTPKIRMLLTRGANIVCDRYVYDTVITDLAVVLSFSDEKIARTLARCLTVLPKPDLVFFVDLPAEIAWQRKDDIPSIAYLEDRRRIYRSVAKENSMIALDGTRRVEKLQSEVLRAWEALLDG
jgi:dTMP kinase